MKIGFLYEPAYWLLLEKLIGDLEHEVVRLGGQSLRLTPTELDRAEVDLLYVLPCEANSFWGGAIQRWHIRMGK